MMGCLSDILSYWLKTITEALSTSGTEREGLLSTTENDNSWYQSTSAERTTVPYKHDSVDILDQDISVLPWNKLQSIFSTEDPCVRDTVVLSRDEGIKVKRLREMVQSLVGNQAAKDAFEELLINQRIQNYRSGPLDIIMIGNPGVGKSTLLASISNLKFESGVTWVTGLTKQLQFQTNPCNPNLRFGDTPGLADIECAKKAALEITQSLKDGVKRNRTTSIFFVVTCECVRIRPADLWTIEQVMGSVRLPYNRPVRGNQYGVIINKCEFLDNPQFQSDGEGLIRRMFATKSSTIPFTTVHVFFAPLVPSLANRNNSTHSFDGLWNFITSFSGVELQDARHIDVTNIKEKLQLQEQKYRTELKMLEARYKEMVEIERKQLLEKQKKMESEHKEMVEIERKQLLEKQKKMESEHKEMVKIERKQLMEKQKKMESVHKRQLEVFQKKEEEMRNKEDRRIKQLEDEKNALRTQMVNAELESYRWQRSSWEADQQNRLRDIEKQNAHLQAQVLIAQAQGDAKVYEAEANAEAQVRVAEANAEAQMRLVEANVQEYRANVQGLINEMREDTNEIVTEAKDIAAEALRMEEKQSKVRKEQSQVQKRQARVQREQEKEKARQARVREAQQRAQSIHQVAQVAWNDNYVVSGNVPSNLHGATVLRESRSLGKYDFTNRGLEYSEIGQSNVGVMYNRHYDPKYTLDY